MFNIPVLPAFYKKDLPMGYARKCLVLVVFLFLLVTAVSGQDVEMIRLSEKVIVLNILGLDCRTNIVVISSRKGLVVIDTEISPYVMEILKRAAEEHFERSDWVYAINTHGHIHHVFGNVLFKDIKIIGHERMLAGYPENGIFGKLKRGQKPRVSYSELISNLRKMLRTNTDPAQAKVLRERIRFLIAVNRQWRDGFELVPPNMTIKDRLELDLGDIHLRLIDWGTGINHGSIMIHIVEENILVSVGGRWLPNISRAANLSAIKHYVSLLKEISDDKVGIKTVIPCHTDFATGQDLQSKYEYISNMLEGITQADQKGLSLDRLKQEFSLERYSHLKGLWAGSIPERVEENHKKNIQKIWDCLEQAD